MVFFSCLNVPQERYKGRRPSVAEPQFSEIVFEENDSLKGSAQQDSNSSIESKFIEFHPLPKGILHNMRCGSRMNGDLLHAVSFTDLLLNGDDSFNLSELHVRLGRIGFKPDEADALKEIMGKFILPHLQQKLCNENLLPYFNFFFEKVPKYDSIVDFGFDLFDADNNGSISKTEIAEFLYLFWNGKIENILKTEYGKENLAKFMERVQNTQAFDFYLNMRTVLQEPYMGVDEFDLIKEKYIGFEAPDIINISYDDRNTILNYEENAELLASGVVKSKVLKSAANVTKSLLDTQVDIFAKEMVKSEKVAEKVFDSAKNMNNEVKKREFTQILVKNLALAAFISDINGLLSKALDIARENVKRRNK